MGQSTYALLVCQSEEDREEYRNFCSFGMRLC